MNVGEAVAGFSLHGTNTNGAHWSAGRAEAGFNEDTQPAKWLLAGIRSVQSPMH